MHDYVRSATAAEFNIIPSTSYIILLTLFVMGSLVVIVALPLGFGAKSLLFIALTVYGAQLIWRNGLLKSRHSIMSLVQQAENSWVITTRTQRHEATLRGDSTVTHLASVLRFQLSTQRFPLSCTLFRDSMEPDAYRQLTVAIRHR